MVPRLEKEIEYFYQNCKLNSLKFSKIILFKSPFPKGGFRGIHKSPQQQHLMRLLRLPRDHSNQIRA